MICLSVTAPMIDQLRGVQVETPTSMSDIINIGVVVETPASLVYLTSPIGEISSA